MGAFSLLSMQFDVLKLETQKWYSSGPPAKNEISKTGVNFVQNVPLKENWETRNFKLTNK